VLVQTGDNASVPACARAECDNDGMSAAISIARAVNHNQKDFVLFILTVAKS